MSDFYIAMQEVLSRSQYDILTGRAVDYRQIIMEALGRAVISLLERVRLRIPDSTDYNVEVLIFTFIIAAALLLLGVSMALTYILLKRRRKRSTANSVATIFDDIAHKRFTLSDLLHTSQEYADKNQFRDAIRYYYIAVLVFLDDKRTIRVDKSKTNAQLARELQQAAPYISNSFISVVGVFEEAWFGHRAIDKERYGHFAINVDEILDRADE